MSALTFVSKPTSLDRTQFMNAFGGIYEDSPWVAEGAWNAGISEAHNTVSGLHVLMQSIVDAASDATRLELLRAHPDLAGRAAVQGALTQASTSEQAGAGLDQCTAEEFAKFQDFNSTYSERFGFPFIMAVKGANRHLILDAFEVRLNNSKAVEFETALAEVAKIARFRLEAMAA